MVQSKCYVRCSARLYLSISLSIGPVGALQIRAFTRAIGTPAFVRLCTLQRRKAQNLPSWEHAASAPNLVGGDVV